MHDIIYSDKSKCDSIIKKIVWKSEWIHILADFDRTLTKSFSKNWDKRPSLISVLRKEWYLSEEYSKKAYELFDKYYPIEKDPNINIDEKKKQMQMWWEEHLKLLIESKLNLEDIKKVSNSWIIELRDWCKEMLINLNEKNIPLIIISANWLWKDSIRLYLENNDLYFPNIKIISNSFNYDSEWYVVDYNKPIIHTFNKDETVLKNMPEVYNNIEKRKNVILLWDSLWDHHMIDWFEYENLLKIWFLNEDINENLDEYKKRYDVIITNDWNLEILNNILEKII